MYYKISKITFFFFFFYSFLINFLAGPSTTDDVLITFNPRIGQYLYLNTYRNGVWEKERLAAYKPFMKGTAFNVLIAVTPQYYEVCLLNSLIDNWYLNQPIKIHTYSMQMFHRCMWIERDTARSHTAFLLIELKHLSLWEMSRSTSVVLPM